MHQVGNQYIVKYEAVDLLKEIKNMKLSLMLAPYIARTSLPLFRYKVTKNVKVILIKRICMWPGIIPKSFDRDLHLKLLGNSNLHPNRPTTNFHFSLKINVQADHKLHNKPQRTPSAMLCATLWSTNF